MKNLSFLFLLLSLLFVGEGRSESFNDFSGGLNTNASWSLIKPNQAYRCENFLLDDPVGALTVRNGYHAISDSLADHKRIYSLNAYRFPAGGSFLFQVVQRDTATNDCDLYVSDAYGFGLSDKLYDWIYPARGMWVNWLEKQYYFNGHQKPLFVDGGPSNFQGWEMVPNAPGQLSVVPVAESGNLDGEYIWAISTRRWCNNVWQRPSTNTIPIEVKDNKARIKNFYPHLIDSICTDITDVDFLILRTRANYNNYVTDSLFAIDSILGVPWDGWDTIVYFDNIPDANLDSNNYFRLLSNDGSNPASCSSPLGYRFEPESKDCQHTPGVSVYLHYNTGTSYDTLVQISSPSRYSFLYCIALLDTATGVMSDTGAVLAMVWDWSESPVVNQTIGLPHTTNGRLARIILRADYDGMIGTGNKPVESFGLTWYHIDTVYDSSVTTYWDTLSPASVLTSRGAYERRVADVIFKGAIIHEARMFAWDDFRVWPSAYDTAAIFRLTDNIEFDLDDGDPIIACASFEGYIVIYKTHSMWLLYTDDGVVYDRVKASKGYGAISEATLDYYSGANLVLGTDGLLVSVDNQYRSNATSRNYISQPIKNLLLRPTVDMLDAAGKVLGHRYFLSYPGTDSTFVYFFNTSSWGIFTGFDFWQGIIYDTISTADFQTFDDLWFIKDDDERLFIWDEDDTTDNGTTFGAVWEKRYISRSPMAEQVLVNSYMTTEASVSASDSLTLIFTDENESALGNFKAGMDEMYKHVPIVFTSNLTFRHLNAKIEAPNRSNLKITGLDLQVKRAGERE